MIAGIKTESAIAEARRFCGVWRILKFLRDGATTGLRHASRQNQPPTAAQLFANCKKLAPDVKGTDVERVDFVFFGTSMREMLKTYAALVYGVVCICAGPALVKAQTAAADNGNTCAAILANDSS